MEDNRVQKIELSDKDNESQQAIANLFLVAYSMIEYNKFNEVIIQSAVNNKVIRVCIDIPQDDEVFNPNDI